jgi:hypothetical protein
MFRCVCDRLYKDSALMALEIPTNRGYFVIELNSERIPRCLRRE